MKKNGLKNTLGICLGIALGLGLLGVYPGCNGDSTTPDVDTTPGPCDTEISAGRVFLAQGDYFQAQDRFFACVEKYPDDVSDYPEAVAQNQKMLAEYGYVVSRSLYTLVQVTTKVEQLVSAAGGLVGGVIPLQATVPSVSQIVNDVISGLLLKEADHLRPYLAELKASAVEPVFPLDNPATAAEESLPVYMGKNNEILWLSLTGELDRGELEILDNFLAVGQGLSETLLTLNWEVNLNAVINDIIDLVAGIIAGTPIPITGDLYLWSGEQDVMAIVPLVASLFASTLNKSPDFLTLNQSVDLPLGGGAALLADAAVKIGEGSQNSLTTFELLRSETDDQKSRSPVAVVVKEGKEYFRLNYRDQGGNPQTAEILFLAEFATAIANIQASVTAEGDSPGANPRASWGADLTWILAYAATFLLQTGGVNALLDLTLAKISPDLAEQAQGFTQSLPLTPNLIRGAVLAIIPEAIELDLGYFFHHPKARYLRAVLPYWTYTDSAGNGYLILEYECQIPTQDVDLYYPGAITPPVPYPLGTTAYICPDVLADIVDRSHFAALKSEEKPNEVTIPLSSLAIASDGIKSRIPYLAWQDPSLNHLLYLNLAPLGCTSCPSSFSEADVWGLNYFTVNLFDPIMTLLESLGGLSL